MTPDGRVWTTPAAPSSAFWQRYLSVFDQVCVFARVAQVSEPAPDALPAVAGPVTVQPLPSYTGPYQYVRVKRAIRSAIREGVRDNDAILLRAAGQISNAFSAVLSHGRPYGVEVVGDPYVVFAPGVIDTPFRPLFRWLFVRQLSRQCAAACAVGYVTRGELQRRYPANSAAFTAAYSSITLSDESFLHSDSRATDLHSPARIISVGSFEQMYKGFDILLRAAAENLKHGLATHVTLVGEGRYRPAVQNLANDLGLRDLVTFTGFVPPGRKLQDTLDSSDLFVLASRTEGLPRAMIEAMARGLPCIGTAVGGIPELLTEADLVPPDNPLALAERIRQVFSAPEQRQRMSATGIEKAKEFHNDVLQERRTALYGALRARTELWMRKQGRVSGHVAAAEAAHR